MPHATPWRDAAQAYLAEEPDVAFRDELRALLRAADDGDESAVTALEDRFRGPLRFGTAGLRGKVGAGTYRMNRVTVSRAAYGLGCALLSDASLQAVRRGVVIGFDARRMSRQFAEESAQILCAQGIPVFLFPSIVATPELAFALLHHDAAAGIMVTASHNPPRDNGYKVYWTNGAQIVPPVDKMIASHIDAAPPYNDIPRANPFDAIRDGALTMLDGRTVDAYHRAIGEQLVRPDDGPAPGLRMVHTAMHGVGHRPVQRALAAEGFHQLHAVPAQSEPDGAFPTVAFPNPEEVGALDLAIALAKETSADVVLANDPDADRLAVAALDRTQSHWVRLSGNEVGFLLADFLLRHTTGPRIVATTIVSSSTLSRMALHHDVVCLETLTGFKWIANGAIDEEARTGARFIIGYEEALGYSCGPRVRDKDGVSATVQMAWVLESLRRAGKTVWQALDDIALTYGCSADTSWSIKKPGPDGADALKAIMAGFRTAPPTTLNKSPVVRVRDLLDGTDSAGPDGKLERDLGASADVLTYWTEGGVRLTVRPSGTEPKVKFYIDVSEKAAGADTLAKTEADLDATIALVRAEVEAMVKDA